MKKVFLNFITGVGSYLLIAVLGIIIPRLVIISLGSAANGLLSSINQVLTYATLLEAGVGMAAQQALYGPVARDDRDRISEIYSAASQYYNRTGVYYFVVVLILSIIFPFAVHSGFSYFEVFSVVFLSGFSGVFGYFFGGKYKILLSVDGKSYVTSIIYTINQILIYAAKIIILNIGLGMVALQASLVIVNLVQALIYVIYFRKYYSWIDRNATPDFHAISQSKSVLIHQISSLIFSNTDAITLSIFSKLENVSLYAIYSLPFTIVDSLIKAANNSVSFSLGQSYNNHDSNFLKKIDAYETVNMVITFSAYTAVYCMLIPFVRLYTDGVADFDYINVKLVLPFTLIYLLSNGRESSSKIIIYAGRFKDTQLQTVLEAAINIVVSVIAVLHFGIYGVLIGTIVALLYRSNDMIIYANYKILKRSPFRTYLKWGTNLLLFFLIVYFVDIDYYEFGNYLTFFAWGIATMSVSLLSYSILALVFSRQEMRYISCLVKELIIKRKKHE